MAQMSTPPPEWDTGLFDVCAEPNGVPGCMKAWCCQCLVAKEVAEVAGGSGFLSCLCALTPLRACCLGHNRGELEQVLGIEAGGTIKNVCMHMFCSCCALAQEANEMNKRIHGHGGILYDIRPGQHYKHGDGQLLPPDQQSMYPTTGHMSYLPPRE